MKIYKNKDKYIMCPNCGRFLTKADRRDPRTHKLACRNCGKWIWFVPCDSGIFQIRKIPQEVQASGRRFF